jgi:hypothetical protein
MTTHLRSFGSARLVLLVALFATLLGCGGEPDASCPKADQAFFEQSIQGHLQRNPGKDGVAGFVIDGEPRYDTATNWWTVPVDSDGRKLIALISCDGRLEFSERK